MPRPPSTTMQSETMPGARLRIPSARKVMLCVGPGGVGKTTVAAALGLAFASLGRKVLVVTIDPSRRLAQALGIDDVAGLHAGTIVTVPDSAVEGGQPLDCLLLDTQQVFDSIVRAYSPDAGSAQRMLDNPVYRATVQRLGGALEYAATAQVHLLVSERRYDLIILDTPPTANAIDFLDAPGRIMEVLDNPAAKFLAGSGKLGMKFMGLASNVMLKAFESLGGGPFVRLLGEFLQDFAVVLGEFKRRAGDVAALLTSMETGVVLTTAATWFSVREAQGFLTELRERRLRIDGVVLNRVDPPVPPLPPVEMIRTALGEQVQPPDVEPVLHDVVQAYRGAAVQAERAAAAQAEIERMHPGVPVCAIHRMSPPPTRVDELRAMGRRLIVLPT